MQTREQVLSVFFPISPGKTVFPCYNRVQRQFRIEWIVYLSGIKALVEVTGLQGRLVREKPGAALWKTKGFQLIRISAVCIFEKGADCLCVGKADVTSCGAGVMLCMSAFIQRLCYKIVDIAVCFRRIAEACRPRL